MNYTQPALFIQAQRPGHYRRVLIENGETVHPRECQDAFITLEHDDGDFVAVRAFELAEISDVVRANNGLEFTYRPWDKTIVCPGALGQAVWKLLKMVEPD